MPESTGSARAAHSIRRSARPRTTPTGTRTPSSTSCTSRRSSTRTTTGSAISAASPRSSTTSRTSASTRSGCCRSTRRRCATTATTSPTTATSTPPTARRADFQQFVREAHRRGLRVITELVVNHTSDQHPWFQAARRAPKGSSKRNFYVWSDRSEQVRRHAHHLHRHREVELDLGRRRQGVLLAPLLQPPAGPELRQPAGAQGDLPRHALLARHGRGRLPARRDSVPLRARGHEQREPARDARGAEGAARDSSTRTTRTGCCWPRRTSGRRTCASTSATATSATWPTTSR